VGLNEQSFLVREVSVTSTADSTFSFREEYSDYVKTDDIWFPNRFTGYFKDKMYFEFFIPVVRFGVEFPDSFFTVIESDTTISGQ